ncbi:ABC transporter substrate-binding protein [Bosea caraganae]|uniref:ABC transporter substrate-binding protein n=1 Tax=Bosea caraganae TaxID=2763117 RepID=A0A370L4M7_9HYPH|nr:ABC transporter substrate-binding protein [Bosea caraganae]RDJ22287.1 ABC transporter substrate-binding protein [Bosea caraganae]RDJ23779.1 ABC transporter substrate-binding protein [Bosea caraganae]
MKRLSRVLAAATLALVASTAARAQEVTLDVLYAFPAFAKFHEPIAAEFMKKNPNIKINFRAPAASYDEGHQTMLRQSVTNQLPDVYYSGFHLLTELVDTLDKRKQVVDLGPMLAAEPEAWRKANYSDALLSLGQVHGKQAGLAFNASTPLMYFNAELVKKAGGDPEKMPDNWTDLLALAKKIRTTDTAGLAYNIHDWPDDWLWRGMVLQGGSTLLSADETKVAFGGEYGQKILETLRSLVTEGGMPLIDWDQSRQQFIAGKMGIFFDTPARLRQVTDLVGERFTMKTALFPIDDKAKGKLPTGGNAALITAKDPAKQKAAWEFIKFVTGPEAQKIVVESAGYMPTNLRAGDDAFLGPFYKDNANFRTINGQVSRAAPWQGYPGGNSVRIWRQQREVVSGVMRGDITPKAGIERIVSETEALMK